MGIFDENNSYNYKNSLVEGIIYTNGNYDLLGWNKGEIK